MERIVRKGRVSSVNYADGMISVTYPDMDDNTTVEIPVFSFDDEYKFPQVGQEILVLHLSNGQAAGFVMGRYWNQVNKPPESKEGVWHKELGREYGEAVMHYDADTGELLVRAKTIRFVCDADEFTVESGHMQMNTDLMDVTGNVVTPQDVIASGKSLRSHTHTGVHGETSGPN